MPIIEEIVDEDIDNMDYDPSDFDANNPFDRNMPVEGVRLRPTSETSSPAPRAAVPQPAAPPMAYPGAHRTENLDDVDMESLKKAMGENGQGRELPEHMKEWKVIYPIYFDANRSSNDGRRVPKNLAVKNPLSTRIVEAAQVLGLEAALELTKCHPKDWANPGRVRVNSSKPKRQLYADICKYLQSHPTTTQNASIQMFKQLAPFDSIHPIGKPKGMVINDILPGISPALSSQKTIEESMNMGNMGKMFGM